MVRLSLKNTFISLSFDEEEEDADESVATPRGPRPAARASLRSCSAESVSPVKCRPVAIRCASPLRSEAEQQEQQVETLNRLIRTPLCGSPALLATASSTPPSFFPGEAALPLAPRRRSSECVDGWLHRRCDEDEEQEEGEEPPAPQQVCRVQRTTSHASMGSTVINESEGSERGSGSRNIASKLCRAWSSISFSTVDDDQSETTVASAQAGSTMTSELSSETSGAAGSLEEVRHRKPGHFQPLQKGYQHKRVPKSHDLREEYRSAVPEGSPTTLMIRNLPNRLSQADLIAELEALGFEGAFDFIYLPTEQGGRHRHHGVRHANSNVGYAFVNFVDAAWADRCRRVFEGHTFQGSAKAARVSTAHVQGLAANLVHYEKAAVNSSKRQQERRPVVMANLLQAVDQPRAAPR